MKYDNERLRKLKHQFLESLIVKLNESVSVKCNDGRVLGKIMISLAKYDFMIRYIIPFSNSVELRSKSEFYFRRVEMQELELNGPIPIPTTNFTYKTGH